MSGTLRLLALPRPALPRFSGRGFFFCRAHLLDGKGREDNVPPRTPLCAARRGRMRSRSSSPRRPEGDV